MGWESLILTDFINNAKTYKSKRINNPKEIPVKWMSTTTKGQGFDEVEFIPFDSEVPPFMIPYLDPEHREGALNG